jgi:hypothetical protein
VGCVTTVENVVPLLLTAVQQDAVVLKSRCIAFINSHLPEVSETEEYNDNSDVIGKLLLETEAR